MYKIILHLPHSIYHLIAVVMELINNRANISMQKTELLSYVALDWLALRLPGL